MKRRIIGTSYLWLVDVNIDVSKEEKVWVESQ